MPPITARHCTVQDYASGCLRETKDSTSTCAHITCTVGETGKVQVKHHGQEDAKIGHHCAANLHQPWSHDPTAQKCGCDCYRKFGTWMIFLRMICTRYLHFGLVGDEALFADILTLKAEAAMQARAALAFK